MPVIQSAALGNGPETRSTSDDSTCIQGARDSMSKPFYYGGQAVMEGVMMRGRSAMAVACRAPNGEIVVWEEELKPGPVLRRVRPMPFVRGAVVLWDTLVLGTRSLMFSANVSLQEEIEEEEASDPDSLIAFPWITLILLLLFGVVVGYFVAPLVAGLVGSFAFEQHESTMTLIGRILTAAVVVALGISVIRAHRADVERIERGDPEEPEMLTGVFLWITVAISLLFAIGLFFVIPVGASAFLERFISSHFTVNLLEGVIRLAMLVGYLWLIARMEDIRRVFAYHGAEHKTINAHEKGLPLDVEHVRQQPLEHIRCGTGFLLIVVLLSVLVFALLGRPSLFWLVASRILLVPVIAALAFEVIRFGASRADSRWVQIILAPGLVLQRLTTREPDDDMLEVAMVAFNRVAVRDGIMQESQLAERAVPVDDLGRPLEIPTAAAAADG